MAGGEVKRRNRAALFAIGVCGLAWASPAAAVDWVVDGVSPRLVSVAEDGIKRTDNCQTYHQKIQIESVGVRTACMHGAQHDSATYRTNGLQYLAIREPFIGKYLAIRGVCEGSLSCEYHRSSDVLVESRYVGGFMITVQVYQQASERLSWHPSLSTAFGEYRFDASSPDYVLSDVLGNPVGSGSIAVSRNGAWLVAELRNKGIALVDLVDLTARRIVPAEYQYGRGMDPIYSLAVSGDGKTVVTTGANAGLSIISVTQTCGTDIVYKMPNSFPLGTERCKKIGATTAGVTQIKYRHHPLFSHNDAVLTLRALTTDNRDMRYVFRPGSSEEVVNLAYLAMGDSFTSGEGDTTGEYLPGTNVEFEKCHVSPRSYPFVVALQSGLSSSFVQSVACSGARLPDILSDMKYMGQGSRLQELVSADRPFQTLRQQALDQFIPGRIPQINFVEHYQPAIVSIGVGGNDAGIIDKLKACAMPGTCRWAQPGFLYATAAEIGQLLEPLEQTYQTIRQLSPLSRLYVVGYPSSIHPTGVCDALTSSLFDSLEREFMAQSIQYLNHVIQRAAINSGATFIDTADAFMGNRLCEQSVTPAVNGFVAGRDAGIFRDVPLLHFISSASFHPTVFGHQRLAQSLYRQSNGLGATCELVGCSAPEGQASSEPGAYWQLGSAPQAVVRSLEFAKLDQAQENIQISVPGGIFAPGSLVTIELHSSPAELGEVRVGDTGEGIASMRLPGSLQGGFHTLFASGRSPNGLSVQIYQLLALGGANEVKSEGLSQPDISNPALASETVAPSGRVLGVTTQHAATSHSQIAASTRADAKSDNAVWWLLLLLPVGIMAVWLLSALLLRK